MISPEGKKEFQKLVSKYLQDRATQEEIAFIEKYYQYFDQEERFTDSLGDDEIRTIEDRLFQNIIASVQEKQPVMISTTYSRFMMRLVSVAVIAVVVSAGIYLWIFNQVPKQQEIALSKPDDVVSPEKNRAMIKLSTGKTIYLDSAANGSMITQGNVQLIKLADGQIAYRGSANELVYNTLINPKGSRVLDMKLSDGSRIWLNAGSSVSFPVAFIGHQRKVTITGEAYFEIARDSKRPFIVSKGAAEIVVLGTHFNVNAYEDENEIKVTLLEGSVRVEYRENKGMLHPGQQAKVDGAGNISLNKNVDLEEVMAWKNGKFSFNNAELKVIMREIMRWYDVEVAYEGDLVTRNFTGDIPRTVKLSELLDLFKANNIHFVIDAENKKMRVMP